MELFIELVLMGMGLAMDAFAVSICKGLEMNILNKKHALLIGLYFGGFHTMMPFLGWVLGIQFRKYITKVDHWIAFVLLGFIGSKMIYDVFRKKDTNVADDTNSDRFNHKSMMLLAIATSIDALAVGITFAVMETPIVEAISIIGTITFSFSVIGVLLGKAFGNKLNGKAEIFGGCILVLIAFKILLQGLNII